MAWGGWSTDSIDRGAVVVLEPDRPEPDVAEQLKRQLRQESDAARQQGYREGDAAARASCRREVDEAARQYCLAVQNTLGEKARLRAEAERDVVRLSLAIARKILHRELRIDPGVALGLVKAAMETVGAREIQVVRTTPSLAAALTSGLAAIGVPEGVRIVVDASLEPGGLVVETSRGEVDASLETQFEEISRGLLQAVGETGRRG